MSLSAEKVTQFGVENAFIDKILDGKVLFEGWIELYQRFRPQDSVGNLFLDAFTMSSLGMSTKLRMYS